MASQWLRARQTKYGAYAAVYILVVLAIIVVANMLADRYNKSYDTTSNQRYSLSDQTKKVISGLKQEDFTVLENGAQQKIATFEEITERSAPVVASQKSLAVAPRLHVAGAGGAMEQD